MYTRNQYSKSSLTIHFFAFHPTDISHCPHSMLEPRITVRITVFLKSLALQLFFAACIGLLCAVICDDAWATDIDVVPLVMSANPAVSQQFTDSQALAPVQWAVHGQFTNITQKHTAFNAPYSGQNSLSSASQTEATTDLTLFLGLRLWQGAELWLTPEYDQGFGFDNTLGLAGFSNGGAYKIGAIAPYYRLPRAFIRQVFAFGNTTEKVDASALQLGGTRPVNNLTLTIGKFAATDIFDNNAYAHDPRADFLNWSVIDAGAYDYAADSWGYTFGTVAEWETGDWTLRGGVFELSVIPNGFVQDIDFTQHAAMLEVEERHHLKGRPGKLKLLAYVNHGAMGSYDGAVQMGRITGNTPDVSLVRRFSTSSGIVLNAEQELLTEVGAFARISANEGQNETYEFSDINRSVSAGLAIKGSRWGRGDDTLGIAVIENQLSGAAQQYFAAGGLGVLIGDGALSYAPEQIVEVYYSLHLNSHLVLAFDYQHLNNPAYNQDRGPVSIYGLRVHAEF
jgi:high affinity Mn2+ porin